jgi:hypothetical protein
MWSSFPLRFITPLAVIGFSGAAGVEVAAATGTAGFVGVTTASGGNGAAVGVAVGARGVGVAAAPHATATSRSSTRGATKKTLECFMNREVPPQAVTTKANVARHTVIDRVKGIIVEPP